MLLEMQAAIEVHLSTPKYSRICDPATILQDVDLAT